MIDIGEELSETTKEIAEYVDKINKEVEDIKNNSYQKLQKKEEELNELKKKLEIYQQDKGANKSKWISNLLTIEIYLFAILLILSIFLTAHWFFTTKSPLSISNDDLKKKN